MEQQHYPFVNVPLPYGASGLEPYIDTKTMQLHHDRHLGTYIENLNKAIADQPELQNMTLDQLVLAANSPTLSPETRRALRRNAGGVYNHFFFFDSLRPASSQIIGARLANMLARDFGSVDNFKTQFAAAAMDVFGSGYAWLVAVPTHHADGVTLKIVKTKNQLTPLTDGFIPLLNIDVWEHAYYLKHYNLRADYIRDFWNVVNWTRVAERLERVVR